jgi:hypothetical protein
VLRLLSSVGIAAGLFAFGAAPLLSVLGLLAVYYAVTNLNRTDKGTDKCL